MCRVWSLPHVYIADNNNYYYSGYCPITNIIVCIVTLEFKMNLIMRINGSNESCYQFSNMEFNVILRMKLSMTHDHVEYSLIL